MAFLLEEIKSAYKSAYSKNQFMSPKKYVKAKIYHGGKVYDLSKRWYVYYSFIDAKTGKMKRQPPITFSVNRRFKTKEERLWHLSLIKSIVNDLLVRGKSPNKINELSENYTAGSCLDYGLSVKKTEIKETTYKDYESRVNQFKDFLEVKGVLNHSIKDVTKRHVSEFLNKYTGAKNRNNGKIALNSVFKVLSDESYIDINFIKEIRNKKVIKKPIKIYPTDEVNRIVKILTKQDKTLLMFIYFEGYMFWRPIEIVRIKNTDIDFKNNVIRVETKTKALKTKIIPSIIADELKRFVSGKKGFVFEPVNADWNKTKESNRRDYYTKKFAKFREQNNIDKEFKLYHFRHTFITKIYLELRKTLSKEDTIKELSLITGHTSKAIYSYIQVNDIELPKDYSNFLK